MIRLFSGSLRRRRSRISALEERSVADNFLQKQQKQRGAVEERPIMDALFLAAPLTLARLELLCAHVLGRGSLQKLAGLRSPAE